MRGAGRLRYPGQDNIGRPVGAVSIPGGPDRPVFLVFLMRPSPKTPEAKARREALS